jgi:hypothetical protein
MIKDDNVNMFYRSCGMVPCSEECFLVFGGVRGYLEHLLLLSDESYVVMRFDGGMWCLPARNCLRLFLRGGEFVNE